jgi:hypothetical protein
MSQCSSLADLEGRVDALTAPFLELLVSEWLWMSTRLTSRVSSSTLSSKTPASLQAAIFDGVAMENLMHCGFAAATGEATAATSFRRCCAPHLVMTATSTRRHCWLQVYLLSARPGAEEHF